VIAVPLSEKALISRIRRSARRNLGVVTGIGDDCAVLRIPPGHEALVTTDFTIEGVHFRPEWHPPEVVGRRCLTRGLSDIAAMGGKPVAAFLSLALPRSLPQRYVDSFLEGILSLAKEYEITLAGGDTAESPGGVLADIVVLGSVPKGQAVLRSGAKPGDGIYATGELGGSADALAELFAGRKVHRADYPRHFDPVPRIVVGQYLREKRLASAMIDISDGLSTDLTHICEESGVGAEILETAIPRARSGREKTLVNLHHALHGGEDYELLFTARPEKHVLSRILGVRVTHIGQVTRPKRIMLVNQAGRRVKLRAQGWEHFSKSRVPRQVTS
jgi:thiamine-monophosphate kinase